MKQFLFAVGAGVISVSQAAACGPDSDCQIENGYYRVELPSSGQPDGAIVFAHGYGGSAQGTMRNKGLMGLADKLNVAIIAVKSSDKDWTIPGAPAQSTAKARDEVAYVGRVVDDAVARFDLNPDRLMAAGFSAGGMLIWNLACNDSTRFKGFVPLSGTFWQPEPTTCDAPPANIIHYHGSADKIVPFGGRAIAETHQGDIRDVMAMYGAYGGYSEIIPANAPSGLQCEARANTNGSRLEFCSFEGGHSFKVAYVERAWDIFMAR